MLIRNYGLFWHVDRVFWGRQRKPGKLCGELPGPKAKTIDFREQRGIYALYANYQLIYVGQAGAGKSCLLNRLRNHRHDHFADRWDRFSWFGTQRVLKNGQLAAKRQRLNANANAVLNLMEAAAIAISEPKLNLQRGRWGDAQQYFQVDLHEAEEE